MALKVAGATDQHQALGRADHRVALPDAVAMMDRGGLGIAAVLAEPASPGLIAQREPALGGVADASRLAAFLVAPLVLGAP
jgi:hypothetical protein